MTVSELSDILAEVIERGEIHAPVLMVDALPVTRVFFQDGALWVSDAVEDEDEP